MYQHENESTRWSESLLDDDKASAPHPSLRSKSNRARNPTVEYEEISKTRETEDKNSYEYLKDTVMDFDGAGELYLRKRDQRDRTPPRHAESQSNSRTQISSGARNAGYPSKVKPLYEYWDDFRLNED
jgi:hypothetical protein